MEFLFGRIDRKNNFVGIDGLHAFTISGIEKKKTSEIKEMVLKYIGEYLLIKGGSNFKINHLKEVPYFRC